MIYIHSKISKIMIDFVDSLNGTHS